MSLVLDAQHLFQGFSKLSQEQRFARLQEFGVLDAADVDFLKSGGIQETTLADKLIENVIGYFQLPLGVATNFQINGKDYVIPMAVEETSIIAALSKSAKWIRQQGKIKTWVEGHCILGQIQIAQVKNYNNLAESFTKNRAYLIEQANIHVAANMVKRGGGVVDLELRSLLRPDGHTMAVIHLTMNNCDAMGANIINQVLEFLKAPIESITGETVSMCILSNLNDQKITHAQVTINSVDPILGNKLQEASLFAEMDAYRAATHNKGVMNGIDPVLIATGNDWRAVEAGIHAYACQNGSYRAITQWRYRDGTLIGRFIAPLVVGTVGGVTALHPTAKLCLRILGVQSADELSQVIAAVGLVQNLGAIKALCTEGIIQGHMKLHIDNLLLAAGAHESEMPELKKRLQNWLHLHNRISLNNAHDLLTQIRQTALAL